MVFTTFSFVFFFLAVTAVFYLLPVRFRKYWLLGASLYFYGNADPKLLLVLLGITALTYVGGLLIDRLGGCKWTFCVFFALSIGILAVYKYTGFLAESWNQVTAALGLGLTLPVPKIAAPLGISFMIFQSTTYLGDIYRGRLQPCSFADLTLFVSFFPTVLSGPIQKAAHLIPQFRFDRKCTEEELCRGILLMVYGFCVKLFVANPMSGIVNDIYDTYYNYSGLYFWIAAVCFSVQIYADFLSYSEIARGAAMVLGIQVTRNFNDPYLATSISGFWRNWHMSLNAWFAEYVYFPLGGSRRGRLRTRLNKLAVLLLSGLWHGASWNYVVWGAANGLVQMADDAMQTPMKSVYHRLGLREDSAFLRSFRCAVVFLVITNTWIFFRVPSLMEGLYIIRSMYHPQVVVQLFNQEVWTVLNGNSHWVFVIPAAVLFWKVQIERNAIYRKLREEPRWVVSLLLGVCAAFILVAMCAGLAQPNQSFIYFEF